MNRHLRLRWSLLVAVNVIGLGVLSFYRSSDAAPQTNQPPFANAVEQRQEMIAVLKEIRDEMKAQTGLLRTSAGKGAPSEQKR